MIIVKKTKNVAWKFMIIVKPATNIWHRTKSTSPKVMITMNSLY